MPCPPISLWFFYKFPKIKTSLSAARLPFAFAKGPLALRPTLSDGLPLSLTS